METDIKIDTTFGFSPVQNRNKRVNSLSNNDLSSLQCSNVEISHVYSPEKKKMLTRQEKSYSNLSRFNDSQITITCISEY